VPVEQQKTFSCTTIISEHKLSAAVLNICRDGREVQAVADADLNDMVMATDSTKLNPKIGNVQAAQCHQSLSRARHQSTVASRYDMLHRLSIVCAHATHLHTVRRPPGLCNARNQAQHRHPSALYEHPKVSAQGRPLEQGDGGPIEKGSKDQPRAHHPAQISGPGHCVPFSDVLMEECVGCAADGGCVCPRNGFGLTCLTT